MLSSDPRSKTHPIHPTPPKLSPEKQLRIPPPPPVPGRGGGIKITITITVNHLYWQTDTCTPQAPRRPTAGAKFEISAYWPGYLPAYGRRFSVLTPSLARHGWGGSRFPPPPQGPGGRGREKGGVDWVKSVLGQERVGCICGSLHLHLLGEGCPDGSLGVATVPPNPVNHRAMALKPAFPPVALVRPGASMDV